MHCPYFLSPLWSPGVCGPTLPIAAMADKSPCMDGGLGYSMWMGFIIPCGPVQQKRADLFAEPSIWDYDPKIDSPLVGYHTTSARHTPHRPVRRALGKKHPTGVWLPKLKKGAKLPLELRAEAKQVSTSSSVQK